MYIVDVASGEKYKVSIMRLFKLNGPEWKFIVIGCLAAIIHGATQPAFAVIFGEFYGVSAYINLRYQTT